ncbi:MAG: hypothetical protein OEZ06_03435 [Myxococcales bacterium]|nr:hypothetical protein [Myxococcales bacterium]
MLSPPEGRWPPVYDAQGLADVIDGLAGASDFDTRFWDLRPRVQGEVFQGDLVQLDSAVPLLDEAGDPVVTDDCKFWLIIGNTCDFERPANDVPWTQIVPTVDLGTTVDRQHLDVFRRYQYSRRFYVPPWPSGDGHHRFADFTRPVTIHKAAFVGPAQVVGRMQQPAWVLLHSCLVRFLARDDGRYDV